MLSPAEANCWASSPRAARSRARKSEGSSADKEGSAPWTVVWPGGCKFHLRRWSRCDNAYRRQSHLTKGTCPPCLPGAGCLVTLLTHSLSLPTLKFRRALAVYERDRILSKDEALGSRFRGLENSGCVAGFGIFHSMRLSSFPSQVQLRKMPSH